MRLVSGLLIVVNVACVVGAVRFHDWLFVALNAGAATYAAINLARFK